MAEASSERIDWHSLLGGVLEEVLSPVGIGVYTDVPVSNAPPMMDILIIRNHAADGQWTEQQRALLPDGIRDSSASHIIIEFKYSESISYDAFAALVGYDLFYRRAHHLEKDAVQSFLVVAKRPRRITREHWGYREGHGGVYRSENPMLKRITLIVLSELSDAPHNVFFKIFARNRAAKNAALATFQQHQEIHITPRVVDLIYGLIAIWVLKGVAAMGERTITKEDLIARGKELPRLILPLLLDGEFDDVLGQTDYVRRREEAARRQALEEGREEGRQEGREEGRQEGREEGRQEGREEGRHEGNQLAHRRLILEALQVRFGTETVMATDIAARLDQIDNEETLSSLFRLALQAEHMQIFMNELYTKTPTSL